MSSPSVPLSYYSPVPLGSRLITFPLSLLLTRIKGYYGSTTYPQLPPTSHSSRSLIRSCQRISALSVRSIQLHHLHRAHPPLPASCVDSVAGPSLVIPKWTVMRPASRPSSCSHHHWRGIDPLICSPSWHSQNIGLFTTYITIVERRVLVYSPSWGEGHIPRAHPSSRGISNFQTNLCEVCVSEPSVSGVDIKPFQLCQHSLDQVPSLAPVKEHRLHHCLIELGSDTWCCILPYQHLADARPYPPSLVDLLPHDLDIIVVLSKEGS
jgi:hypothetical protein